jgi:hypothetical protein
LEDLAEQEMGPAVQGQEELGDYCRNIEQLSQEVSGGIQQLLSFSLYLASPSTRSTPSRLPLDKNHP